jgi:hypothetical protein
MAGINFRDNRDDFHYQEMYHNNTDKLVAKSSFNMTTNYTTYTNKTHMYEQLNGTLDGLTWKQETEARLKGAVE